MEPAVSLLSFFSSKLSIPTGRERALAQYHRQQVALRKELRAKGLTEKEAALMMQQGNTIRNGIVVCASCGSDCGQCWEQKNLPVEAWHEFYDTRTI